MWTGSCNQLNRSLNQFNHINYRTSIFFNFISGLFVLNLACRDPKLRLEVLKNIQAEFPFALSYKVPDEVNEVLFCGRQKSQIHLQVILMLSISYRKLSRSLFCTMRYKVIIDFSSYRYVLFIVKLMFTDDT